MPKRKNASKLFDDSDDEQEDPNFRVNEKYATAYDKWRQKEEFQKLKDRYGDVSVANNNEEDESSSEEDENPYEDITPAEERDFFKKLAMVKSGAYRNYKPEASSSGDEAEDTQPSTSKSKPPKKKIKKEPMYLKDYERRLMLERGGRLSDEDENENEDEDDEGDSKGNLGRHHKTYVEEQREIKESFKSALKDEDDGDFLQSRQKTAEEQAQEEEDYTQWLKGQKDTVNDEKIVKELKPLRDYWENPSLDEGERFLRDYILNRQYEVDEDEEEDASRIPSYDEIVNDDDDEAELDRQEEFEHKFNFRFEEPDAEFLKSYPRTVADSLRRKEDKRKQQRDDYKKRKDEEKKKQIEEVKQLKNMKRREILEKLEKLRRTAGLDQLPLDTKELEDDFNPEEYDRLMQKAFGDDYYGTAAENEEKPEFSDDEMDGPEGEDGDMTNWDDWTGQDQEDIPDMDEDKPSSSKVVVKKEITDKKQERSLLAQALSKKKPVFDPNQKKFEEYFDDYYKMDFEDIIGGDVRCRFKYRDVPANDFGLSVEEILSAKDKELNSWVSVKKMSQYRTRDEEVYDQKAYQAKSGEKTKKQRILSSIYGEKFEVDQEKRIKSEPLDEEPSQVNTTVSDGTNKKKRKKKKKKKTGAIGQQQQSVKEEQEQGTSVSVKIPAKKKKKRLRKGKVKEETTNWDRKTNLVEKLSNERLAAYGVNAKKLKNRVKYSKKYQAQ